MKNIYKLKNKTMLEGKEFKSLLNKANKAEQKLHSCCGSLGSFFQPYFDYEISVLYQEGDGFCIVYEKDDGLAPANEPVKIAFDRINQTKRTN